MKRNYISGNAGGVGVTRADGGPPRIFGYAAVFYDGTERTEYQITEQVRERIMPEAFSDVVGRDDVRALFNHDGNYLLGRTSSGTLRLSIDDVGLRYEIDPPESAASIVESIERGDLSGSSFSVFMEAGKQRVFRDGDKTIREVRAIKELLDVGPVTFPAFTATTAQMRSGDDNPETIATEITAALTPDCREMYQAQAAARRRWLTLV